jgi:hypothetical protein
MKKLLFGIAALGLLATASCKKDDKDNGPSNRIVIAGETLAVSTFQVSGSSVNITATSGSTAGGILFSFGTGTATPSDGTYKVVEDAKNANEVSLLVGRGSGTTGTFYDSQDGSVNVTVGHDGSKMTISMPDVQVKPGLGATGGNVTVSANAQQL